MSALRPPSSEIPTQPGVYRFLSEAGQVIYVGKAKNLRNRLNSYFGKRDRLPERTQRMLASAREVTWTIVGSEIEALQLEFSWIKEFSPEYNIRFRDDKSYPYLAMTTGDEYSRVYITRNRDSKRAKYLGPFTNSWAIRESLDTLLRVYPVRSCSTSQFRLAAQSGRPCILAEIKRCSAPCVGRISQAEHQELAKNLIGFVARGGDRDIDEYRQKMNSAAASQQYELAAALRDDITALEHVLERSAVVLPLDSNCDVFGVFRNELAIAATVFIVRGGRIRGTRNLFLDVGEGDADQEAGTIELLLRDFYASPDAEVPPEVVVPAGDSQVAALQSWLGGLRKKRCQVITSVRGDRLALQRNAERNAQHALTVRLSRRAADLKSRADALSELQATIGIAQPPLRIECFDVSHLSGTNQFASMVVFEDGLPRRNAYRKFKVTGADDTASLAETLERRFRRLQQDPDFGTKPDLIVLDGGQPQLSVVTARLSEQLGDIDVPIVAMAKRLEEVWISPSESIVLPRSSEALFLLQRIRDEAHRFAISGQRASRSRSISTQLVELPGVGEKRARILLRRFGSVRRLREATVAEIADLPGFSEDSAKRLLDAVAKLSAPTGATNSPNSD